VKHALDFRAHWARFKTGLDEYVAANRPPVDSNPVAAHGVEQQFGQCDPADLEPEVDFTKSIHVDAAWDLEDEPPNATDIEASPLLRPVSVEESIPQIVDDDASMSGEDDAEWNEESDEDEGWLNQSGALDDVDSRNQSATRDCDNDGDDEEPADVNDAGSASPEDEELN
jgi:hypothetical protein